jgi:hypothetical protein
VETTRMVRYLLMKGAKTNIRDNKGKLPMDYAKDVRIKVI